MGFQCGCLAVLQFFLLLFLDSSSEVYVEDGRPKVAVLIDTDPALTAWFGLDVDDDIAMAFLAGTSHVRLLGATSTFGNALASTTCSRLQELLDELGLRDTVPYACGPSGPWESAANPMSWLRSFSNNSYESGNAAAEQLARLTRDFCGRMRSVDANARERLVWLSLGAMTNIAAALRLLRQSSTADWPDEIVVLGARSDGGWELNVWSDASAAEYVLVQAPSFIPVTLVPIDAIAGAVVGVRQLDQFRRECENSWIGKYVGLLKRFAWIAGHLQELIVAEPEPASRSVPGRSAHGFRPWDVAAAAAVAYPGQLFAKSSCRRTELSGSNIRFGDDEVPCDMGIGVVRMLSHLAVPQFLAVVFNGLCTSLDRGAERSPDVGSLTHDTNEL